MSVWATRLPLDWKPSWLHEWICVMWPFLIWLYTCIRVGGVGTNVRELWCRQLQTFSASVCVWQAVLFMSRIGAWFAFKLIAAADSTFLFDSQFIFLSLPFVSIHGLIQNILSRANIYHNFNSLLQGSLENKRGNGLWRKLERDLKAKSLQIIFQSY